MSSFPRRTVNLAVLGAVLGLAGCAPAPQSSKLLGAAGRKGLAIPAYQLAARNDSELAADMEWMREAHVNWLRFDLFWAYLESSPGVIDWSVSDRIVEAANRVGIRLLAVVHTMPAWARPERTPVTFGPVGEPAQAAFARFLSSAARRYKGRIAAWEMWNEANVDQFWSPRPSASDYVALAVAGSAAIKEVDPPAIVITGGLGGASGAPDVSAKTFARDVMAVLPLRSFDGFGVHPYPPRGPLRGQQLAQVDDVEKDLSSLKAPLELWGTETGFATLEGGEEELRQAELVTQTFQQWLALSNAGPLFWYTMRDWPEAEGAEAHFGLFRADGSAKPAALEFAAVPSEK